jgi:hypothetical protein
MKKVKEEYYNVIGLYHRKSAVFDVIRPHLLIKSSLPSPVRMPQPIQAVEPYNKVLAIALIISYNLKR